MAEFRPKLDKKCTEIFNFKQNFPLCTNIFVAFSLYSRLGKNLGTHNCSWHGRGLFQIE